MCRQFHQHILQVREPICPRIVPLLWRHLQQVRGLAQDDAKASSRILTSTKPVNTKDQVRVAFLRPKTKYCLKNRHRFSRKIIEEYRVQSKSRKSDLQVFQKNDSWVRVQYSLCLAQIPIPPPRVELNLCFLHTHPTLRLLGWLAALCSSTYVCGVHVHLRWCSG